MSTVGKGAIIGSDLPEGDQLIRTNAGMKALSFCNLHYIRLDDLRDVLKHYPEDRNVFTTLSNNELTYNLSKCSQNQDYNC